MITKKAWKIFRESSFYKSTWSYENRVSEHFVIFLNFPCLIACLLCCLLMSYFLACLVVRDLCRSECRQNYYLTPLPIFSLPTILSLTQVTVLSLTQVTISGRLKLVSVPFSSLVLYIGHAPWEKFPGEHHVKLWDGTKLLRFAESASSNRRIIFSFHLAKRINHPDPGRDRKVQYCSLF